MKDAIKKFVQEVLGKSIGGFALRVVIAVLMLVTGASTDVGDAVGVALDKDRSIAAAVQLINETPKTEIVEAVEAVDAFEAVGVVKDVKLETVKPVEADAQ